MKGEFPTSTRWETRLVKLDLVYNQNSAVNVIAPMKSLQFTTMALSAYNVVLSLSASTSAESAVV